MRFKADARRLQARAFVGARSVAGTLHRLHEATDGAWLARLGRHLAWIGRRPVVAGLPVWEALGQATDVHETPGPGASGRRTRHRALAPHTPPRAPAVTRDRRPAERRVTDAGQPPAIAAARSLSPRMYAARLAAIAGEVPAVARSLGVAPHGAGPARMPMAPAAARPVPLCPARNEHHWRHEVVLRALDRIGGAGRTPAAAEAAVWSIPVGGPRCEPGLLEMLAAASQPAVAGELAAHGAAARSAGVPGTPSRSAAGRSGPPEVDRRGTAREAPRPGSGPIAAAPSATSPGGGHGEEDESHLLLADQLRGGPLASLRPPRVTAEPDFPWPAPAPSKAGGPGRAVQHADPGPDGDAARVVPVPRDDLGDLIAEILRDEARRHGIDV
jgi:hypothetical protein